MMEGNQKRILHDSKPSETPSKKFKAETNVKGRSLDQISGTSRVSKEFGTKYNNEEQESEDGNESLKDINSTRRSDRNEPSEWTVTTSNNNSEDYSEEESEVESILASEDESELESEDENVLESEEETESLQNISSSTGPYNKKSSVLNVSDTAGNLPNKKTQSGNLKEPRKSIKRYTEGGNEYQKIITILLRQRVSKSSFVGSEVSGVGKLDDIVFMQEGKGCRFFQVKHSKNKEPCKSKDLLTLECEEKKTTKFQLMQYFKSHCTIKESKMFGGLDIEEITLVTNKDLVISDQRHNTDLREMGLENDIFLRIDEYTHKAVKYALNVDSLKPLVYDKLKSLSKKYLSTKVLKADEIIDEFLEKIRVVFNYPDHEILEVLIFQEVFNENIFKSLNQDILSSHMKVLEDKLLMDKEELITKKKWISTIEELRNFIKTLKLKGISESNVNKYCTEVGDICFDIGKLNNVSKDISTFLTTDAFNILYLPKVQNIQLSTVKFVHSLQNLKNSQTNLEKDPFYVFPTETLLDSKLVLDSFESNLFGRLIIICSTENSDETIIGELACRLGEAVKDKSTKRKIILVSDSENYFISKLKEIVKDAFHETLEAWSHSFRDLTSSSQKEVLEGNIMFQGQSIMVNSLLKENSQNANIEFDSIIEFVSKVLDDKCLWEVLIQRENVVSNDTKLVFPDLYVDNYIKRHFHENLVNCTVFKNLVETDIFLVTRGFGVGNDTVKEVFNRIGILEIQEWNQSHSYTKGVIVGLPTESSEIIFNQLCYNKNNAPTVHWLIVKNNHKIFHIESKKNHSKTTKTKTSKKSIPEGDVVNKMKSRTSLSKIAKIKISTSITEEAFINKSDSKVYIIVGESGIGKSTTLTCMGEGEKSKSWVFKVDLFKFFGESNVKDRGYDTPHIDYYIDLLEKMCYEGCESYLERKLFEERLLETQDFDMKILLLLDGFNEIKPMSQPLVFELISSLRNNSNIDKIVITAQSQDKTELVNRLQEPAYFLDPLNHEEQKELMARHWEMYNRSRNPCLEVNHSDLLQQADEAINTLKKTISDEEGGSFTQIPLNLIMLAEVWLDSDSHCFSSNKVGLRKLYSEFISKKFRIYFKEQNILSEVVQKEFQYSICKILQEISVKTFFTHQTTHVTKELSRMKELEEFNERQSDKVGTSTLAKIGLLTVYKENLYFIHESFAHFFLCEYIKQNLTKGFVQDFFISHLLAKNNFKVSRKFLDRIYKSHFDENNKNASKVLPVLKKANIKKCTESKTFIHLLPSLNENNRYLVRLVLGLFPGDEMYNYVDKFVQESLKKKTFGKKEVNFIILSKKLKEVSKNKLPSVLTQIVRGDSMCQVLTESLVDSPSTPASPLRSENTAASTTREYQEDCFTKGNEL
uniref:NACHT domain-containing protein n=1 Tax=Graphocephala atropunctata TaxID=36148 RepID=A0A1B6LDV5_9HEMI